LKAEDVDWEQHVISYARRKTGSMAIMRFDKEMAEILRDLQGSGLLFPYLSTVRAGDRATEFKQRCHGLGIKGVSLHSYRYAWAECCLICSSHPHHPGNQNCSSGVLNGRRAPNTGLTDLPHRTTICRHEPLELL